MSQNFLTVTAITKYLKYKLDQDPYLRTVTIKGEVSNFRLRKNSHQYFNLKDDHAKINAVMYRRDFDRIGFSLEEGMSVFATGQISLYPPSGSYQITITHIEPDGTGALYLAFEQLKKKLDKEGLFSRKRKEIPAFPKKIAVVTSPSGAVIHDIMTTVSRRFPICEITLYPAVVQGTEAALSIISQLERIKNSSDHYDTLIIGRGGGSIEDLWPFNEEAVVRALVDYPIPVISCVGHETDTTLVDFVSDVRAATPTAAAEVATPRLSDILLTIKDYEQRTITAIDRQLTNKAEKLDSLLNRPVLTRPMQIIDVKSQFFDAIADKLAHYFDKVMKEKITNYRLIHNKIRVDYVTQQIRLGRQELKYLENNLSREVISLNDKKSESINRIIDQLMLLNPLSILKKGYSVVENQQGDVVQSINDIRKDDIMRIRMTDGIVKTQVLQMNKMEDIDNDRN